jgi:hypothetical protein
MKVRGSAASWYSGEQGLSQGIWRGMGVGDGLTTDNCHQVTNIFFLFVSWYIWQKWTTIFFVHSLQQAPILKASVCPADQRAVGAHDLQCSSYPSGFVHSLPTASKMACFTALFWIADPNISKLPLIWGACAVKLPLQSHYFHPPSKGAI